MNNQNALAEEISTCVTRLLNEDIGSGDITAQLIPEDQWATATVITRESAVLCGTAWVDEIFQQLDARVTLRWLAADGDLLDEGQGFLELEGPARSLLNRGARGAQHVTNAVCHGNRNAPLRQLD